MFLKIIWTLILSIVIVQSDQNDINILRQKAISSSLDNSINPCDDFYAHACGKYAEQHLSEDYMEITSFLDYQYNEFILHLIDSMYQNYQDENSNRTQTFVTKTLTYLKSCRSETKRDLKKYFEQIKPGPHANWPLWEELTHNATTTYQWSGEAEFDIWTLLGKLQAYGLDNVLINPVIVMKKTGKFELVLEPAHTEDNSTVPDLKMLAVLLMGLGVEQPKPILRQLLATNKILVDILESCEKSNGNLRQMTLKDLKSVYNKLNLHLYVNELANQDLPPDTVIFLRNPEYFQYLNDNMWQTLQKSEWCNYLMLKFLNYLVADSATAFKSLHCIKDLRNKMDLAVNFLFYHHNYGHKADIYNSAILEIFQNIKEKFLQNFIQNHLNLTSLQQKFLIEKLQNMRLNIGNLPEMITFDKVEKFYANLPDLHENNYYKNHLLLLKHRFQQHILYTRNQSQYYISSVSGLNIMPPAAFYVPQQNMIVLPFSSLRYPLFDIQYHDVYKYSNLGFILAHELQHAFDINGLYFDLKGEFLQSHYNISKMENFQSALKCLQSQHFTNSINERLADIVAIDISYEIFKSKCNKQIPTGVECSSYKEFYLNLAQFFCGKGDIIFVGHDTDAQRLNQIVMNSQEFALAFQCEGNSKMNPGKKCRLY